MDSHTRLLPEVLELITSPGNRLAVLDTSLTYMKKLEALDLVVGSIEMQNEAVSGSTYTNVAILEVLDMLEDSSGDAVREYFCKSFKWSLDLESIDWML